MFKGEQEIQETNYRGVIDPCRVTIWSPIRVMEKSLAEIQGKICIHYTFVVEPFCRPPLSWDPLCTRLPI